MTPATMSLMGAASLSQIEMKMAYMKDGAHLGRNHAYMPQYHDNNFSIFMYISRFVKIQL